MSGNKRGDLFSHGHLNPKSLRWVLTLSYLPYSSYAHVSIYIVEFLNFNSQHLQLFHWLSPICFPGSVFCVCVPLWVFLFVFCFSKAPHKSLLPTLPFEQDMFFPNNTRGGTICSQSKWYMIKLAVSHCSNFWFYISPCFGKRYLLWTQLWFLFSLVRCMQHLKLRVFFFFKNYFISF